MILPPRLRKPALAVHLTCSIGWIGAVLAYVALGLAATTSTDAPVVRGSWISMELIGWWVLLPLAVGTLLTGLVLSLGTRWGLLRHYWVLFAFVLTLVATVVLVLHLPSVSAQADRARTLTGAELQELGGDLFHAVLALVLLLVILVLNIYKPPGMTRYGWRRRNT